MSMWRADLGHGTSTSVVDVGATADGGTPSINVGSATSEELDEIHETLVQVVAREELSDMQGRTTRANSNSQLSGGTGSYQEISDQEVRVTFYSCPPCTEGNLMYSGVVAYEGAAACSWDMELGTRFTLDGDPTGRVYTCLDRGLGPGTAWVDVFFEEESDGWQWQSEVGSRARIQLYQ
jgi:hypothetical protein